MILVHKSWYDLNLNPDSEIDFKIFVTVLLHLHVCVFVAERVSNYLLNISMLRKSQVIFKAT